MGQKTNRKTKLIKKIDKCKSVAGKTLIDCEYKNGFLEGLEQAKKILK